MARDDVVMVPIPRSALTVLEQSHPVTITQRNCMAVFGLSKRDYLRMAGKLFPVTRRGQLRIAKYEDVQRALCAPDAPASPEQAKHQEKQVPFDPEAALRKAGFRRAS
jgi:hypothetical protein